MSNDLDTMLSENLKSMSSKLFEPETERLESILNSGTDSIIYKRSTTHKKKLLFCAIITLTLFCLSTIAFAVTKLYLYDSKNFTIDKGLRNAEEKGLIHYTSASIRINNNVSLLIKGVVSDTIRTVIYSEIKGSKEHLGISATLSDSNGNKYSPDEIERGAYSKDPEGTFQYKLVFSGGPNRNSTLLLRVNQVGNIKGNWEVALPVKIIKPMEYDINKQVQLKDTTINIEKIRCTASTLEIRYKETGKYLNIAEGSVTAGNMKAKFIRGTLSSMANQSNAYTGSVLYDPIDLTKANTLKWSIYTDYTSKTPIEIEIPIKQVTTR